MAGELVLVSGASGYIASHVVKQLQEAGYQVRGTVRSLKDEKKIRHLYTLCPNAKHKLELVEANLLDAGSWAEAVKGCTYVQHVASPLPVDNPRDENEVIKPAVEGTLNVLKAAAASGTVKRVVLTSSLIAIATTGGNETPYTEKDWGNPSSPENFAYTKSKILAEKAAWDYVNGLAENQKFELAVVNPSLVVGPTLHGNPGSSVEIVTRLLTHQMPMCPRLNFAVIDVRDVALAHLKCMTLAEAAGNRLLLVNKNMWLTECAAILDKEFRSQGYNVPTKPLPDVIFSFLGLFSRTVRTLRIVSGKPFLIDNSRMRNVLGINPIDVEKSIVDMAYSMIENGVVKRTSKYRGLPST